MDVLENIKQQARDSVKAEKGLQTKAFKRGILPYIPTVAEIVALLGLAGILTFVQFNGKWNEVSWGWFVCYLAIRVTMKFCGRDATSRSRVDFGQREEEHVKLVNNLRDAAKDVDTTPLKKYIDEVANPHRKAIAWKAKLAPKIERQNTKIEKIAVLIAIAEKKGKTKKVERLKKKLVEPTIKRDILLEKSSDEYIKENYYVLPVKYDKLRINQFFVGDLDAELADGKCEINVDHENHKSIATKLPLSIGFLCLITLTGLDSITFGEINILTLLLDIISISIDLAIGWFSIGMSTLAKQRKVLANKTAFLKEYTAYEASKVDLEQDGQSVEMAMATT